MPSRRLIAVHRNSSIPESPKIVKRVIDAMSYLGQDATTVIEIPWDNFVFSNVELPKSSLIRKGLEMIRREGPPLTWSGRPNTAATRDGERVSAERVQLRLEKMRPARAREAGANGWLNHADLVIVSLPLEGTLRHELLHLTQWAAENLIRLAKGEEAFTEQSNVRAWERRLKEMGIKEGTERESFWSYRYGVSKREALSMGKGSKNKGSVTPAQHALLDIEFHTDALTVAMEVMSSLRDFQMISNVTPNQVLEMIGALSDPYVKKFTPKRRYAFYASAYRRAAEEINKFRSTRRIPQINISLGQSLERGDINQNNALTAQFLAQTSWQDPEKARRQEASKQAGRARAQAKEARRLKYHTAKPKRSAKPTPRPRPAPASRAAEEARPRSQAPKREVSGYQVRHEPWEGRMAYVIYDANGQRTGKYFFSQEKAQAYIAKVSRAG
jgi:hypothetical protein